MGCLGGALAVAVLGGTGLAIAAIPSSKTGAYTGCVNDKTGVLRVVNAQAGKKCAKKTEKTITWSQKGPIGPQGPQGVAGLPGAKGDTGARGPAGIDGIGASTYQFSASEGSGGTDIGPSTPDLYYACNNSGLYPEVTLGLAVPTGDDWSVAGSYTAFAGISQAAPASPTAGTTYAILNSGSHSAGGGTALVETDQQNNTYGFFTGAMRVTLTPAVGGAQTYVATFNLQSKYLSSTTGQCAGDVTLYPSTPVAG